MLTADPLADRRFETSHLTNIHCSAEKEDSIPAERSRQTEHRIEALLHVEG